MKNFTTTIQNDMQKEKNFTFIPDFNFFGEGINPNVKNKQGIKIRGKVNQSKLNTNYSFFQVKICKLI